MDQIRECSIWGHCFSRPPRLVSRPLVSRLVLVSLVGAGCREGRGPRGEMAERAREGPRASVCPRPSTFCRWSGPRGPLSCFPRYVPLPPSQFGPCPSSLPATEAWGAHAFSRLGPLNTEAPFSGAGWSCARKTAQGTLRLTVWEPVWNSK